MQTIAGKEDVARFHLRRQGFRVFCPKLPSTIKRGRSFKQETRPLFPGYCFVGVEPVTRKWRPITGTLGVSKLVMFGNAPARMPSGVVEKMIAQSNSDGCLTCDRDLKSGDQIRLIGGPFDDWLGQVVNIKASDRVIILIDLLSRQTPMTVQRSQLRSVDPASGISASLGG
ncbi:MAG: transcription termination/antitermination NusG family protein [Pseudomonadota bacterium]